MNTRRSYDSWHSADAGPMFTPRLAPAAGRRHCASASSWHWLAEETVSLPSGLRCRRLEQDAAHSRRELEFPTTSCSRCMHSAFRPSPTFTNLPRHRGTVTTRMTASRLASVRDRWGDAVLSTRSKVAWQSKRRTNGAALALGQPPRARCPHVPRARTRRPCGQRAWDVPSHARECRASRACCLSSARTGAERQHAGAGSASVTTEATAMVQNDQAVLSRKKQ